MHYMPDTETKDSASETFWPEGYKWVIRKEVRQMIGAQLSDGRGLRRVYQKQYSGEYASLNEFNNKIADMIAIGAENGADNAFDDVISSFKAQSPLPEERSHARYFWPQALSAKIREQLRQVIIDEYSQDNVYKHAYEDSYQKSYRGFSEFISQVALLVVIGASNGADDMLEALYRSFTTHSPLPPARRYPRRLKG